MKETPAEAVQIRPTRPFVRWLGGKRWLVPTLSKIAARHEWDRYIEPFLGGGAFFFALQPEEALLGDLNEELVVTYWQVQKQPRELIRRLRRLTVSKLAYERWRARHATDTTTRAVRFLYLNRTAFAGVYRVNRDGAFNVPYGGGERRPDVLWTENLITSASAVLKNARIRCADFEEVLGVAGHRDLVYCDPTYTVLHNNNGFIRYNESTFSWADQLRLAAAARKAAARGAMVIVSNADHDSVRQLYVDAERHVIKRQSLIAPSAEFRRYTTETLFVLSSKHRSAMP